MNEKNLKRFLTALTDVVKEFDPRDDEPAQSVECDHAELLADVFKARRLLFEMLYHHEWTRKTDLDLTDLVKLVQATLNTQRTKTHRLKAELDEERQRQSRKPYVTDAQLESLTRVFYAQIWDRVSFDTRETLRSATRQELSDLGIEVAL